MVTGKILFFLLLMFGWELVPDYESGARAAVGEGLVKVMPALAISAVGAEL